MKVFKRLIKKIKSTISYRLQSLAVGYINKEHRLVNIPAKLLQLLSRSRILLLPIKYFSIQSNRKVLIKETTGFSIKPTEFKDQVVKVEKKMAALGYNVINKAFVNSNMPLVISKKKLLRQYYYTKHVDSKTSFKSRLIIENNQKAALVNFSKANENIDKGIFFGGSWPLNWYHWVVEILSRIELLEMIPENYQEYPLLVPNGIIKQNNLISIIKTLFPNHTLVMLDQGVWYQVDNLIWIDSPVILTPNFKGKRNSFNVADFNFHWDLMRNYRKRILNLFDSSLDTTTTTKIERVFLVRSQNRRKYNQDEIAELLAKYNFKAIYTEDMTVAEQVKIFNQAKLIVGPTGAAWTNLLFCKANTKGLIWMPNLVRNAATYANLAYLSGVELIHYYYHTDVDDWNEINHKNIETKIEIVEIERMVKSMLDI